MSILQIHEAEKRNWVRGGRRGPSCEMSALCLSLQRDLPMKEEDRSSSLGIVFTDISLYKQVPQVHNSTISSCRRILSTEGPLRVVMF